MAMELTDRLIYTVEEKDEGRKIISILEQKMQISSGMIRVLKYNGGILLNGSNARVNETVKKGDVLILMLNCSPAETDIIPNDITIDILYEDDALIIADKPYNMVSHPVRNHLTDSLLNAIVYKMKQENKMHGMHLVSRLDRDTSGIVIIAKNPYVQERMKLDHDKGLFIKKYIGITAKEPPADSGEINLPIIRKEGSSIERTVAENGAPSLTEYRVLQRLKGFSVVEFRPKTGRTHQIRVHCLYSDFPLIGDTLYGNACCSLIDRQALHAYKVEFIHPVLGKNMEIISKMPEDMANALKAINL